MIALSELHSFTPIQETSEGIRTQELGSLQPRLDDLVAKIGTEIDDKKRNELIHEAFKIHQDDIGHIPLHQQALAWGFADGVKAVQLPTNHMYFKWVVLKSKALDSAGIVRH